MKAIKTMFLCAAFLAVMGLPAAATAQSMGQSMGNGPERNWSNKQSREHAPRAMTRHAKDQRQARAKRSQFRQRDAMSRGDRDPRRASRVQPTNRGSKKFRPGDVRDRRGNDRVERSVRKGRHATKGKRGARSGRNLQGVPRGKRGMADSPRGRRTSAGPGNSSRRLQARGGMQRHDKRRGQFQPRTPRAPRRGR